MNAGQQGWIPGVQLLQYKGEALSLQCVNQLTVKYTVNVLSYYEC